MGFSLNISDSMPSSFLSQLLDVQLLDWEDWADSLQPSVKLLMNDLDDEFAVMFATFQADTALEADESTPESKVFRGPFPTIDA